MGPEEDLPIAQGHGARGIRGAGRFAVGVFARSIKKFFADQCPSWAAALAFTTLFALVPITVLSFSIFSVFSASAAAGEQVRSLLFAHFLPGSGDLIYNYIQTFSENAGTLSFFGFVFLIFMAFSLLTMLEKVFLRIWQIPKSRPFFARFFIFWVALTLVPILIAVFLYFSSRVEPVPYLAWAYQRDALIRPLFITWAAFFVLYRFLPRGGIRWMSALSGALVAGTLWEGAKFGFDSYVNHFSTLTQLYGSLGIIPIFLLWLYFTWILVLYGAEVAYLVQAPRPLRSSHGK